MSHRDTLIVLSAGEPVAEEIARLAVALGQPVISVRRGGAPEVRPDETWVHGVDWIDADPTTLAGWEVHLERASAVVLGPGLGDLADGLPERLARHAELRLVRIVVGEGETRPSLSRAPLSRAASEDGSVLLHVRDVDSRPLSELTGEYDDALDAPGLDVLATDTPQLRLETVAMAGLRAALEPEHRGLLDHDAVARLGDAMMIQS